MNNAKLRAFLRWTHVILGLFIGAYVCSPLHADPAATLMARAALVPLLATTGLAMWQQGRLARWYRRFSSSHFHEAQ